MDMKSRDKLLKCLLVGMGITSFLIVRLQQRCINQWKKAAAKNKALFILTDQWIRIKQEGKTLKTFFRIRNYKKIAIYGMGTVGLRLAKELKHSGIEILYGIDKNAPNIYSDFRLVTLEEDLLAVDAIVVTVIDGFDEVSDILSEKVDCPIIAIEDILNEI